jgi:hypothetical protein
VRLQAWSTIFAQAVVLKDAKTQARARQAILALGGVEQIDQEGRTFFTLPPRSQPAQSPVKGESLPQK